MATIFLPIKQLILFLYQRILLHFTTVKNNAFAVSKDYLGDFGGPPVYLKNGC